MEFPTLGEQCGKILFCWCTTNGPLTSRKPLGNPCKRGTPDPSFCNQAFHTCKQLGNVALVQGGQLTHPLALCATQTFCHSPALAAIRNIGTYVIHRGGRNKTTASTTGRLRRTTARRQRGTCSCSCAQSAMWPYPGAPKTTPTFAYVPP